MTKSTKIIKKSHIKQYLSYNVLYCTVQQITVAYGASSTVLENILLEKQDQSPP